MWEISAEEKIRFDFLFLFNTTYFLIFRPNHLRMHAREVKYFVNIKINNK